MSAYQQLPKSEKDRIRRNSLAYYHRNKATISVKRKIVRDTDPTYKVKRQKREDSPRYKRMRLAYHLRTKYGLTITEFNRMYRNQHGKCAVCSVGLQKVNRKTHVDHDHKTGIIRELLCSGCNCALGHVKEDVSIVRNLLRYLQKWK